MAFCAQAELRVNLDISIIHQKGMDKDFVLKNEIHTKKVFFDEDKSLKIELTNGYRIYFRLKKKERKDIFGPSDLYQVGIQIVNKDGQTLKAFSKDPLDIYLNNEQDYIYQSSQDQLIDIKIRPTIFTL